MRKAKIAALECALLVGIVISARLTPLNFPLATFLAISISVVIAANILFFRVVHKAESGAKYRTTSRTYLGLVLIVIYWVLYVLRHR